MSTCWIFLDRANAVRVRQCWYLESLIMTLTGRLLRLAKRGITGESEHSEGTQSTAISHEMNTSLDQVTM